MRRFKRVNIGVILALLTLTFAAAPVLAQNCEYDEWDVNDDEYLDEDEFLTAYDDVGYYGTWDEDDDDALTLSEWEAGVDEHLDAFEPGNLNDWDEDGDGEISEDELHDGLFQLLDDDNDGLLGEDDWELFTDESNIFC